MGSFLPYAVEVDDGARLHRLGDFARLKPAIAAANHALEDQRTTLAVVKDLTGTLVYAADRSRVWTREGGEATD